MDEVGLMAADLARQRMALERETEQCMQRGEDLTAVLAKLAELRARLESIGEND